MSVTLPEPVPKKTEKLIIAVEPELKDGLSKISRATGLSMAEITRRWLSYGLEQAEHASKVSA